LLPAADLPAPDGRWPTIATRVGVPADETLICKETSIGTVGRTDGVRSRRQATTNSSAWRRMEPADDANTRRLVNNGLTESQFCQSHPRHAGVEQT